MFSGFQDLPSVPNLDVCVCFSCEQIFSSRKFLEEHVCSKPLYLCSCGTEFTSYSDMVLHCASHEPGQQVLDHQNIKKQRTEKRWQEEEKLKQLLTGEVIWDSPKPGPGSAAVQKQMLISPNAMQNVTPDTNAMANIGAPTVDLWTLFQPIVTVKTMRSFSKVQSYICGKCGQSFTKRKALVSHHNSHIADKVLGCIGCGLLLSSRKVVPRFHPCNSPNSKLNRFKLITAKPLTQMANGLSKLAAASPVPKIPSLAPSKIGKSFVPQISITPPSQRIPNQRQPTQIGKAFDMSPRVMAGKNPLKPVQIKPVVSNSKFVVVNTPAPPPPSTPAGVVLTPGKGYECRVCHVYFESINVLQRHKCAKAHEFLMKHKLSAPGNRQRSAAPLQVPSSSVKNVPKPILPAPMSSTDRRLSNVTKDTSTAAADDDCFIVESGPEKPAEVIYQVTSSVPIKT
ncbi:unnamed protein product [Knipowitschia caucasica]